jgi:hypothetical protein
MAKVHHVIKVVQLTDRKIPILRLSVFHLMKVVVQLLVN